MDPTRYRIAQVVVIGVVVAWLAVLVVDGGSWTGPASEAGAIAAAAAAGFGCWRAARRHAARARLAWILLGSSAVSWGLGRTIWALVTPLLGRESGLPPVADVALLASAGLAAGALVVLLAEVPGFLRRGRTLVDGMIVAVSLLLLSWLLVLGPVLRAWDGRGFSVVLAYPVADVVLGTLVAALILASRSRNGVTAVPLPLVAAGVLVVAVADSGFAYLASTGSYAAGHPLDAVWVLGHLLVALASIRPAALDVPEAEGDPADERVAALLPYFAVTAAMLASVGHLAAGGEVDTFSIGARCALIGMLVLRQVLTVRETEELTGSLRAKMEELVTSEQRLHGLVQHSSDIVTVLDRSGTVRFQSDSVERVLGYRASTLRGRSLNWLLDPPSVALLKRSLEALEGKSFELTVIDLSMRDVEGRPRPLEVTITNLVEQAGVDGYVLNMRDVSEQRALQQQLQHEAGHDALTALGNRTLFTDRLEGALVRSASTGRGLAILFLDLDGFKVINDTMGHAAGDALLVHTAQRLRRCVRPGDTIARLGGDEFAVLVEDGSDADLAITVAERISQQLDSPFSIAGRTVNVTASVGIATAEPGISTAEDLLRNADLAMYRAKAECPGGWKLFDGAMHEALVDRLQLEAELNEALERHQFVLHYQPTFEIETGRISGVEALVRWQHPTRGLLGPGAFISEAERTGLIVPLGTWVLQQACRQAVAWHRQRDGQPLSMAVNVSGLQLDASFPDTVAEILRLTGMAPEHLVLEMTESMLIDTSESVEVLTRLKALGVSLAIDDFGTGYSSLSYLHLYPVDVLKIDRSFVGRMRQSPDALAMVEAILQLAKSLNLTTVAEGIEEMEDVDVLRGLGCQRGQGFLFARPMPAIEVNEMLGLTAAGLPATHGKIAV
jgi:diguanylate cyclase (GGDEF)-like protein/PAS domain S-box-containing protein